jgi:hypothetical protein
MKTEERETRMVRLLMKILVFPLICVGLFSGFFFFYLSQDQRGFIINKMLYSIPGINNFINEQYKTQLTVTAVKNANTLKTAFASIDFLATIKNNKNQYYIAIYPYVVEAGFDLNHIEVKESIVTNRKNLIITLSEPKILNVDIDEQSRVGVIRDDIGGDADFITRPAKIAFEYEAKHQALKKNILLKAKQNAEKYYKEFWKDTYSSIDINFKPSDKEQLTNFSFPHLPIEIQSTKEVLGSGYKFSSQKSYNWYDGFFSKEGSTKIWVGYSHEYKDEYKTIFNGIGNLAPNEVVLKYIDPTSPIDNGVICKYNSDFGTCFIPKNGELFYSYFEANDREHSKQYLGEFLYLSFNADAKQKAIGFLEYKSYIKLLDTAYSDIDNGNYNSIQTSADDILQRIDGGNPTGRTLKAVAETLSGKQKFAVTENNDRLQLLLEIYSAINLRKPNEITANRRDILMGKVSDIIKNNFLSYIVINANAMGLNSVEVDNYIQILSEKSYLSNEIINSISDATFREVLRKKISIINNSAQWKNEKIDQQKIFNCYKGDACNDYVYYDTIALEKIYSKGHKTVPNKLQSYFNKSDSCIAVVVTRSGVFFDDFDAFVFERNRMTLIRDITADPDYKRVKSIAYTDLNPGTGMIAVEKDRYSHPALIGLLQFVYNAHNNRTLETESQLLQALRREIVSEVKKSLWRPKLS